ncbi:MAG: YncE family protein, partial [Methylophilus sp.]
MHRRKQNFRHISLGILLTLLWSLNTAAGNIAYITNQGSDSVSVLDIENKKVTHTIEVGKAPVGVAIASKQQRVYISNANSQTVSIINSRTQKTIQEVPVNIQAVGI